jgi:hypothetical protein
MHQQKPVIRTSVRVPVRYRLQASRWNLKAKSLLVLGRFQEMSNLRAKSLLVPNRLHKIMEHGRHVLDATRAFEQRKQDGPLTDAQVEQITQSQMRKVGRDARRRATHALNDQIMAKPLAEHRLMQHKCAKLLGRTLAEYSDIASVVNLGARVDVVSAYFAPRYPHIQFLSVDFQPDLADHNADLPKSSNWSFASGYALRMFRQGELRADLVVMTSTACLFNNLEMDSYVTALRDAGVRYVVLNEPWWPQIKRLSMRVPLPEDVPIDEPYCSGNHGHYHFNYPGKLARGGFVTTHCEMIPGPDVGSYCVQIVARR